MKRLIVIQWVSLLLIGFVLELKAQMGIPGVDPTVDPTGTAGVLKAHVMTGGGYDAHGGNASRSVTDLHLPNTPGVYGLDFTRYWNSTSQLNPEDDFLPAPFASGGWTHSWLWVVTEGYEDYQPYDGGPETFIYYIKVNFPDGHSSQFNVYADQNTQTSPYSHPTWADAGTLAEHLCRMAPDGSQFSLFLSDGGSILFQRSGSSGFRATVVTDPHGLQTTIQYDAEGELRDILAPAGRSLHIDYDYLSGRPDKVVSRVTANNGLGGTQQVTYGYTLYSTGGETRRAGSWYALTQVNYGSGQASASYTYTAFVSPPGVPIYAQGPVLKTADDPRYEGAMTRIRYLFRGGPGGSPKCQYDNPQPPPGHGTVDYLHYTPFPVEKEISLDTGLTVSEFQIPCNGLTTTGQRTEIRGAGGQRKFYYGRSAGNEPGAYYTPGVNGTGYWTPPEGVVINSGWQLSKVTEFAQTISSSTPSEFQNYKAGYPWRIFDGRNTRTNITMCPGPFGLDGNGRASQVSFVGAGTGSRSYNWLNPTPGGVAQNFSALPNTYHHWLYSQTDENNNTISYKRDALQRVSEIDYPDGSYEGFTYNGFNQVLTHRMANGNVVHYDYDGRGLLKAEWDDYDGQGNATTYTYDSLDRVYHVSHAWSRAKGTTWDVELTYNPRHQVLTETYPATNGGANPYKKYQYDNYGNCTDIWDEMADKNDSAKACHYTYDGYRRCTSYTEPLNAPDWNGQGNVASRTWNWYYDRQFDGLPLFDASTHTSREWRVQLEPAFNLAGDRRLSAQKFDFNDRVVEKQSGMIATSSGAYQTTVDTEVVNFEYDENDNKTKFTDARGRVTGYEYDLRNRQTKVKEEPNQTRITQTYYDWVGNKTQVTFPNTTTQKWQNYDAFGQPWVLIDERNNTTNLYYYAWGPMKKLQWVITHRSRDGGGTEDQGTNFYYDGMGRHTWTLFPDGSSELNDWGVLGQVQAFKTRKNQTKRKYYDARGRESVDLWDSDAAPFVARVWDETSRIKSISNQFSVVDYTYDAAGQVKVESNTIAGSGPGGSAARADTTYYRYPSGEAAHIGYPSGAWVRRNYTARGQLQGMLDSLSGGWQTTIDYTYNADATVDHTVMGNGLRSDYGYDGRGKLNSVSHYTPSPYRLYTQRTYYRENRDRIWAWTKSNNPGNNPLENGRGNRFDYDAEGQLQYAWNEATDAANSCGSPERMEFLYYDELGNRVGANYLPGRGWGNFMRKDNGLNQYRSWTRSIVQYDDDVGGSWGAPQIANGVMMQDGGISGGYNALNQPILMWNAKLGPADNWLWFGYDPLGRCVKRWVAPATASYTPVYSNPATYFYYDGWNLIQEGSSATSVSRSYIHGGRVDEMVAQVRAADGARRYSSYDARGDCILQTDPFGNLTEQYAYDTFGKVYYYNGYGQTTTGSAYGNRFLFTGREWLDTLELYDFRQRLYNPELGRFMQPDPKQFEAGDYNLYRYCHNDPINKTDPFGLASQVSAEEVDYVMGEGYSAAQQQKLLGTVNGINSALGVLPFGDSVEAMRNGDTAAAVIAAGMAAIPEAKEGMKVAGAVTRVAGPVYKTSKEATTAAKTLGLTVVKGMRSMGEKVFTDGKRFFSRDKFGHIGGAFKELNSKGERVATVDKKLERIGK